MAGNPKKQTEADRRAELVIKYWKRGIRNISKITRLLAEREDLVVDRTTVGKIMQRQRKKWQETAAINFEEETNRTLQELEDLIFEYWDEPWRQAGAWWPHEGYQHLFG